jgi:hypothetical protein
VGSTLVAVGGYGVGAVPHSLEDVWLHATAAGRALSMASCVLGVVGLVAAWWALRDATSRVVVVAAGTWAVPLLLTVPLFSRDVYAYAGQAHLLDVGLDPYTRGPADAPGPLAAEVDDVWSRTRSPYGPVFLQVAALLVRGQHVLSAVFLLRMLAVAGLVLVGWGVHRLAADPSRALWLAVANPLVLLHGVGGAHNDLLMAGLLTAGLVLGASAGRVPALTSRDTGLALAAAAIVLAALVKAPAAAGLAFVPFLVPTARIRAAAVVAASAVVVTWVLTAGAGLGWGWLHTLGAGNTRRSLLSVSTGVGVALAQVAGSDAVDVAHAVGLVLAGCIGLGLLLRAPRLGALRALGLTMLAAVVLSPVVQPWYLLWALPALAVAAGKRLTVALAAASAVLCLLVLPSGRHLIRPPLYGVPALLVAAVAYAATRAVDVERSGRQAA